MLVGSSTNAAVYNTPAQARTQVRSVCMCVWCVCVCMCVCVYRVSLRAHPRYLRMLRSLDGRGTPGIVSLLANAWHRPPCVCVV